MVAFPSTNDIDTELEFDYWIDVGPPDEGRGSPTYGIDGDSLLTEEDSEETAIIIGSLLAGICSIFIIIIVVCIVIRYRNRNRVEKIGVLDQTMDPKTFAAMR